MKINFFKISKMNAKSNYFSNYKIKVFKFNNYYNVFGFTLTSFCHYILLCKNFKKLKIVNKILNSLFINFEFGVYFIYLGKTAYPINTIRRT